MIMLAISLSPVSARSAGADDRDHLCRVYHQTLPVFVETTVRKAASPGGCWLPSSPVPPYSFEAPQFSAIHASHFCLVSGPKARK